MITGRTTPATVTVTGTNGYKTVLVDANLDSALKHQKRVGLPGREMWLWGRIQQKDGSLWARGANPLKWDPTQVASIEVVAQECWSERPDV
jgi:hypothetical protein